MSASHTTKLAIRSALIYSTVATLWVLLSDLVLLATQPQALQTLIGAEIAKASLFIAVTSIALYVVIRQQLVQQGQTEAKLLYQANILKNVSDAVISVDFEHRIQSWNLAAEAIYGWQADQALGRNISELLKPFYPHHSREQVINYFQQHGMWRGEVTQYRKDGTPVHIVANTAWLKDDTGKPIGIVSVNRDVTEQFLMQEKLQQTADMLNAVITASPIGIIHIDAAGLVSLWNPAVERLYGLPASELIGKPLPTVPEHKKVESVLLRERLLRGETITDFETQRARSDGSLFDVSFSAAPLVSKEGEYHGAIIIASDITNRKRLEAEVFEKEKLFVALEHERKVQEIRTRFMRMVSHEFRTPIAIINSSYDLLKSYFDRMTPDQREERLENIAHQVTHLRDLLNEVSILLQTDPALPNFVPVEFDFVSYCDEQIAEIQRSLADSHTIEMVSTCESAYLKADSKLMRHVVNNLIYNAIKYSPTGSTLRVKLACDSEHITFEVKDTGIGIPEQDQEHIFEPFYRASNVDQISGSGLGLAIVKQIVDLHRGTIDIQSRVGEGATFVVRLPHTAKN